MTRRLSTINNNRQRGPGHENHIIHQGKQFNPRSSVTGWSCLENNNSTKTMPSKATGWKLGSWSAFGYTLPLPTDLVSYWNSAQQRHQCWSSLFFDATPVKPKHISATQMIPCIPLRSRSSTLMDPSYRCHIRYHHLGYHGAAEIQPLHATAEKKDVAEKKLSQLICEACGQTIPSVKDIQGPSSRS